MPAGRCCEEEPEGARRDDVVDVLSNPGGSMRGGESFLNALVAPGQRVTWVSDLV